MTLIRPFRALRPVPTRAREIIAPPYDVLSSAEARERAKGKPWSFLHVSKAEIDLPAGTDPYARAVYATAAENLQRMRREGVLMRDANPYYYAYRATWTGGRQTGLACVASLDAYASGRIKKHELTTPVKETDRVRQIEALNAQTGPVMMAYPHAPEIDRALKRATERDPDVAVTADDDVTHELWVIGDAAVIDDFTAKFEALPALYIADGHHRSAAAARVAQARGGHRGVAPLLPERDLPPSRDDHPRLQPRRARPQRPHARAAAGRDRRALCRHPVAVAGAAHGGIRGRHVPGRPLVSAASCCPISCREGDPIARLPITLLTRNLIEPILGIADPRTDKRIDFVGGGRGLGELERRVNSGEMAVAFALYPTSMDDLMAVSDAGGIMPPKSTWFEPKLADGMVSHVLD